MSFRFTRRAALICVAVAAMTALPAAPALATAAPVVDVDLVTIHEDAADVLTSDQFSTQSPNELLVAMFSADGPSSGNGTQVVSGVTGCGLTWTEVGTANDYPGIAAVFSAYATSTVTDCQVSGDLDYAFDGMVHILSFTGAASQITEVHALSTYYGDAGFAAVRVPADNSRVYQVGHNWGAAEVPTPVGGDTQRPQQEVPASVLSVYLSDYGDTSYVAQIDDPLAATPTGTDQYSGLALWFPSEADGGINSVGFAVAPAS
ncbi:hypothetical protein HDA40_002182 [Hamadaea flava]|uniref:Secreted protein n=1 Tax=Hamadaea flava TaxID=1742688 RepID=A0ABV8LLQ3_9ACTN|nr:hypothetical protein [Hamadaea flava]MCP2323675.1 hypothetical protein [Hamadaea flava]